MLVGCKPEITYSPSVLFSNVLSEMPTDGQSDPDSSNLLSTVNSQELKVEVPLKLLLSQSKFSGPENLLRDSSSFEIPVVEMQRNEVLSRCSKYLFIIRGYFEISVFEILRVDCNGNQAPRL